MAITDKNVHRAAAFARSYSQLHVASVPISQAAVSFARAVPPVWSGANLANPIVTAPNYLPPWAAGYAYFVENIQVFCTAVVATAQVDVVSDSGASLLTGLITPVALSAVQGTLVSALSTRRFVWRNGAGVGGAHTVKCTTNGTGTITNLLVTLTIRPVPLGDEVVG